ncbi:MAG: GNAT family N-acetyltransferase [Bacilli bacterium]|jgi:glutathione synthase/RimK-type ligase-like ATP-grasp enzyme/ribosomal protein S18 acetylase RimI-like enzyme|nr:GNAT family N-acetyltransferase [Bacilli bacterium]
MHNIRLANFSDYSFLSLLEESSFDKPFRNSKRSLKHSLKSKAQLVYIFEVEQTPIGAAILFIYPKSYRLYSFAILEKYRHQQYGRFFLNFILQEASNKGLEKVSLEARVKNEILINFYLSFGFIKVKLLKDYYQVGEDAYKMHLILKEKTKKEKFLANLVVTTKNYPWLSNIEGLKVVSAQSFLNKMHESTNVEYRVFNLSHNLSYQSLGYYVSLLARARNLRVIPSVSTLEDLNNEDVLTSIGDEVFTLMQKTLKNVKEKTIEVCVFFGVSENESLQKLIKALLRYFEAPLLKFTFYKRNHWHLKKINLLTLDDVKEYEHLKNLAKNYFLQNRFALSEIKQYKYDLAILVDEDELTPPSDLIALKYFKEAAESIGFYTEFLHKYDYHRIGQFDALFIRTNTSVHNFTYKFSRLAYAEGLIVIDDPWSILQCSNKLYFHESMKKIKVATPKTLFVSRKTKFADIISELKLPLVLKQPDSASSLGVFKVETEVELEKMLKQLFKKSALIVAQEYLKTTFDWRVGVLDGEALYVCKYYMAKNHWQIFHWQNNHQKVSYGRVETLLVEDVDLKLIRLALKAASRFGSGLYGVDIKEVSGQYYVVEVNDNPSIEHNIEDKVLGKKLYLKIVQNILNKIEKARKT